MIMSISLTEGRDVCHATWCLSLAKVEAFTLEVNASNILNRYSLHRTCHSKTQLIQKPKGIDLCDQSGKSCHLRWCQIVNSSKDFSFRFSE